MIAAINAQSQTATMSLGEMQEKILPRLLETAAAIGADLAYASH